MKTFHQQKSLSVVSDAIDKLFFGKIKKTWTLFLQSSEKQDVLQADVLLSVNRSPLANDLDWHEFMSLSFSHHYEILAKTETLEERAFYIHQAATLRWDKYTLRNNLKSDLFHHQSQMPNNFATTMPSTRYAAKAISMFKDDYLLDFINVEELG